MQKREISFDGKSFIFNGRRKFINAGELHYFRIPRSQWKDRLLKCKQAFLNTLGAYIAWNWHEDKKGAFNFKEDRDLNQWLSLAEEVGLLIFIRPGPYICSEWDFGGFPNWLIAEDCELRSSEPNYIKHCTRYLNKVNEIIRPHLITKRGKVFLYQVENEFEVGDIPYHLKLKEIVEKDGIDVPICTNENAWVRGTDIIEAPDPYLRSWLISEVMNKIRDLIRTQPDKPPLGLEVGTHMFTKFYGQLPFSDGYRPPELDEVYLKSLIAAGISGFNWYMYHGGTNIGYWTGRDIATTYDFEAPIREWGELSRRYDISRRIGGFLESFEEALLETIPVEGECWVDEKGVDVFVRKDKEKAFIFLSNTYAQSRSFKITLKELETGKEITIPKKGKYQLPGYSMTIIPINLKLSDELTLLYSTSEVFYFLDNGSEKLLILYREPGLNGEICLKIGGKDTKIINYTHQKNPQFITVEGREKLKLIILDKETAPRTWFFNYQGKKCPVISNIYFLEEEKEEGRDLQLTFQVKEGENWLKVPLKPRQVKIDGKNIDFYYGEEKEIAEFNLPEEKFPQIYHDLSDRWKVKEENLEVAGDDNSWLDWQPWEGLENHGFLKNGYASYKTNFEISEIKRPLYLTLTGFQDEASVYLNGQYIKSGRDNLRCEVSSYVKKGDNLLLVLVESEGHHYIGERSFNGINCPLYLSHEEKSLELKEWKRRLVPEPYPEKLLREEKVPEISPGFNDNNRERVRVDRRWDSRLFKNPYEECFLWYRTEIEIPADYKGKNLALEFEEGIRDKIYLFVNGKFSGQRENTFLGRSFVFDLDDKIKDGKNSIALGIKADRWVTYYGLHGTIKISAYDNCLNKGWKIKEGISGQRKGYFKPDFDDSGWEEVEAAQKKGSAGSLIWFRKRVKIEVPSSYIAPLRLTLKDTSEKALIYFNGTLIGRYSEKGAQEDFYIYEDLIKEENLITILVDGRESAARLGRISISPYYIAKRIKVGLLF